MARTYSGTRALKAHSFEPEAYEAERQALIAELKATYGEGRMTARVSSDFNTIAWTWHAKGEPPAPAAPPSDPA